MSAEIPVLRTARLILRAPENRDFDAFAAFQASNRSRFVGGPRTRRDALALFSNVRAHWAHHGFGRWLVADAEIDAALGLVGLLFPNGWPEPEIAWALFDTGTGRGIATEAARASRAHAYDRLGWTTAVSLIDAANSRSLALARRLDCTQEGMHHHPVHGDLQIWRHPAPEACT